MSRNKGAGTGDGRARREAVLRLLRLTGLASALLPALGLMRAASSAARDAPGSAASGPAGFMARAERMRADALASGDQGFGAVIVRDGRIVGEAPSRVVVNGDPTAHAEMEAIRDAARRLGTRDLAGCAMYSTSHPCPMCEAAAYWANIDVMHFGPQVASGGTPRLRRC